MRTSQRFYGLGGLQRKESIKFDNYVPVRFGKTEVLRANIAAMFPLGPKADWGGCVRKNVVWERF
jgi:hypothetical protein